MTSLFVYLQSPWKIFIIIILVIHKSFTVWLSREQVQFCISKRILIRRREPALCDYLVINDP